MSATNSAKLLIVDGHAYAYRAFHAIRHLNSPTGQPTNAIYGFIKMLAKMQAQVGPTHAVVIWDGGLAAERQALLPEYKETRPPMPPELGRQIDDLQRYLNAAGVASLCRDGVEADDWIAAVAREAAADGAFVVIASSDKDFMQLVAPRVGLLNPNDKTEKIWTADDVQAKADVRPEQVIDWLSLIGDSVDNIAGVPGVGPKTAADLLRQFGSVDAIYSRLDEVKSDRVRAALQGAETAVRRNQTLIRLHEQAPEPFSLGELRLRSPDAVALRPLYQQWGFKTLLAQVSQSLEMQKELSL